MEIVRAAYDAFERGDLDAVSQLQDPAMEWQTSAEDPDAATHRGRVAVRRYFEGYMETFPGLRAELEECIGAPDGRVFTTVRYTGRARASGMDMDWRQSVGLHRRIRAVCPSERSISTATKPSKPPGSTSRQCRRRTWSGSGRQWRR